MLSFPAHQWLRAIAMIWLESKLTRFGKIYKTFRVSLPGALEFACVKRNLTVLLCPLHFYAR